MADRPFQEPAKTVEVERIKQAFPEAAYRNLVDSISEVLYQIDGHGRWVFLNQAWVEITGFDLPESLGRPVHEFILPEDRPQLERFLSIVLNNQFAYSHVDLRLLTSTGDIRWVEMYAGSPDGCGGACKITGTLNDISERKQTELALQKSEEAMRVLYSITASQHLSSDERLQALLVLGCQHFGLEIGYISRIVGDRWEVQESFAPGFGPLHKGIILELAKITARAPVGEGGCVMAHDASQTRWGEASGQSSLQLEAYLSSTVNVFGKAYGALCFCSLTHPHHPFTHSEREFLKLMAQWVGSELEREANVQQFQRNAAEIARQNQALTRARLKAVESARSRSACAARMREECYPLLQGILNAGETLLQTPLSPNQAATVSELCGSARELSEHFEEFIRRSDPEDGAPGNSPEQDRPDESIDRPSAGIFADAEVVPGGKNGTERQEYGICSLEEPITETMTEDPLDPNVLKDIRSLQIEGEPDFLSGLIDIYLEDSRRLADHVRRLAANEDGPGLRQAAHALKGSSTNLGARFFATLCAKIETLSQAQDFAAIREILPYFEDEYLRVWLALQAERK